MSPKYLPMRLPITLPMTPPLASVSGSIRKKTIIVSRSWRIIHSQPVDSSRSSGPASGKVRNQYRISAKTQHSTGCRAQSDSVARRRGNARHSGGVQDSTPRNIPTANQSMSDGSQSNDW